MVSNALSRRRHVITSPAICIPPWPPPPPPPIGVTCTCSISALWDPVGKVLHGTIYAWLTSLPDNDPVKAWVSSNAAGSWANPYSVPNHGGKPFFGVTIPPGTTSITITVGFVFSDGHKCSAHCTVATPGA
jgi:hypothetical protein